MNTQQEHYNWIMNIIDSCLHDFHFTCVDKLIELYMQQHPHDTDWHTCLQQQRTHAGITYITF